MYNVICDGLKDRGEDWFLPLDAKFGTDNDHGRSWALKPLKFAA